MEEMDITYTNISSSLEYLDEQILARHTSELNDKRSELMYDTRSEVILIT